MLFGLISKEKELKFERLYDAPKEDVWRAWTEPERLKQWWGPKNTFIPLCNMDLKVGGEIHIVQEAGEAMGKYAGTQWPLKGTFTSIEEFSRLTYTAQSWTEGSKDSTLIDQEAELTLTEENGKTRMKLVVSIIKTGRGAGLAAFGMKFGYNQQFTKLKTYLAKEK